MATSVKNGEEITLANTSELEIEIYQGGNFKLPSDNAEAILYFDDDNSGTIQVSVGESIVSAHKAWAAGKQAFFSFKNGVSNIRLKASGAGQKVTITV